MTIDPSVVAAVEAAVAADPKNVPLRLHLAGLLLESGRAAAASVQCGVALQCQPDHPDAIALAARAAEADGDPDRAAAFYHLEVARRRPADPFAPARGQEDGVAGDGWDLDGGQDWDRILQDVLATEDVHETRPALTLADVGGMDEVKRHLESSFLAPLRSRLSGGQHRSQFEGRMRGGMLLWGPPGCGKTFLAQAVASELGARFLSFGLPDVLEIWLGQSKQNLHSLFQSARDQAPCLIFLDEIDALGHKRSNLARTAARNVVVQLLAEMDGLNSDNDGIFVLAATNQPWDVDPALRRPGRFDRTFCVLPPDEAARQAIMQYHLRERPLGPVDLADVARRTDRYSGADLRLVCQLAARRAWAAPASSTESSATPTADPVAGDRAIQPADLLAAVAEIRPSTRSWFETARSYVMFANQDGEYDDVKSYLRRRQV